MSSSGRLTLTFILSCYQWSYLCSNAVVAASRCLGHWMSMCRLGIDTVLNIAGSPRSDAVGVLIGGEALRFPLKAFVLGPQHREEPAAQEGRQQPGTDS